MTKMQAIYLTYICAEAINNPDFRKLVLRLYGEHGVSKAIEGIKALASEYAFEAPLL